MAIPLKIGTRMLSSSGDGMISATVAVTAPTTTQETHHETGDRALGTLAPEPRCAEPFSDDRCGCVAEHEIRKRRDRNRVIEDDHAQERRDHVMRRAEQVFFFVRPDDRTEESQEEPAQAAITKPEQIDRDRRKSSKYEAKQCRGVGHEVDPHRHDEHGKMKRLALQLLAHGQARRDGIIVVPGRLHGRAMVARHPGVGKKKIPGGRGGEKMAAQRGMLLADAPSKYSAW
jgi:hypothetical protein